MGVTQLWNILEPVKRPGSISTIQDKTLCVDLSVWIVEALGAQALKVSVPTPHLRNLFFRVCNLIRAGVKLVFVVDGEPPKVKWEAIVKRTQGRVGARGKPRSAARQKVGRSNFRIWVNECIALLKLLGVPYVESTGEAEALCGWLNAKGIVDGCVTNDGDVFLYGGRTVYKDLSISTKKCTMDCYNMDDIEAQFGLTRQSLVGLAILLGCDYLPQGVPGVGKEIGLKLVNELHDVDLLERFNTWKQMTDSVLSKTEESVKKKALKVPGFPNIEVVTEFLSPNLKTQHLIIPNLGSYKCPDLKGLQDFCLKYLEWPEDYTMEKVLPLVTYWQMNHVDRTCAHYDVKTAPQRIVKLRMQNKVECYEVLWRNDSLGETCSPSFTTIESRKLFKKAYSDVVEEFELTHVKPTKKLAKSKGEKAVDSSDDLEELCGNLDDLSLTSMLTLLHVEEKTAMKCTEAVSCKSTDVGDYDGDDDEDDCLDNCEPHGRGAEHGAIVIDLTQDEDEKQVVKACQRKKKVRLPRSIRPQHKESTTVNNRKAIVYPPYYDSDSDSCLLGSDDNLSDDHLDCDIKLPETVTVRAKKSKKPNVVPPVESLNSKCGNDSGLLVEDRQTTEDLEDFVPLSLSERLGKKFLGQRNVLDTLRNLSTIDSI